MFLVLEIQKTGDQIAHILTSHATRPEAESKWHMVLAAAAVSSVPQHSATLLDDRGYTLAVQCYEHPVEPEIVQIEPDPTE